MKYKGILPQRKTWVKVIIFILAAYMLYREIMAGQWMYIPITILVLLACFFKKEQIISKEGVDIQYMLFRLTMHNYWKWEEITTLHTDYLKVRPNVMLHIGKDIVTRTYVMESADCQAALKLAAEMNSNIYIENLTEEEQEKRDREILHRQEVARAQKAAKKRKR